MTLVRTMTRHAALLVLAYVAAGFAFSPGTAWAETWVLMGREGGCVSIADAALRKPEFKGVAGPEDLAQKLRADGYVVTLNEIGTAETRIVAVEAPDAGIGAIFAPEHMCEN